MQQIPLHPSLVHVPIALAVLMPFILIGLLIFIRRGSLPAGAWWIGVLLQATLVIGSLSAIASGHKEEERVEDAVPHESIEKHEHLAGAMTAGGLVVLVLSAAALRKTKATTMLQIASIAVAFVVMNLAAATGHEGGELVFKHGAATPNTSQLPPLHSTSPEEEGSESR
jgi:uncharacterized membrane protein